jgi:tetratricopeptide (TPR) repeat protein
VFPNYWPAWFEYADWLAHSGPYYGIPQSETRAAFENVVGLNPDLAPAWEHLFWVAVAYREADLADSVLANLRRIRVDSLRAREVRYDILQYYEHLADLTRSRGAPNRALGDAAAVAITHARAVSTLGALSTGLHIYGFHRAQIDLLDRVEQLRPPSDLIAAHQYGRALAWAGRGAWDSALVAADRFASDARRGEVELLPVHIATLGTLLGAIDPAAAAARLRRVANTAALTIGAAQLDVGWEMKTELVWLEGIQAFNRRDARALGMARERLRAMPPHTSASALQRSLAAFSSAMAGRTREAGDSLAALERDNAGLGRHSALGEIHPALNAVNRLFAARWLVAAGDTTAAISLLTFYETIFPATLGRLYNLNVAIAPLAMAERARISAARGEYEESARLYSSVLERMDTPGPSLRAVSDDAARALARLLRDQGATTGRPVIPGGRK